MALPGSPSWRRGSALNVQADHPRQTSRKSSRRAIVTCFIQSQLVATLPLLGHVQRSKRFRSIGINQFQSKPATCDSPSPFHRRPESRECRPDMPVVSDDANSFPRLTAHCKSTQPTSQSHDLPAYNEQPIIATDLPTLPTEPHRSAELQWYI